ncbi:MAG: hypothetical protein OEY36_02715 [Gammaproteobacteria bacterium]|nr:hypothetical protein [Gammaproteobacteria bacterium]
MCAVCVSCSDLLADAFHRLATVGTNSSNKQPMLKLHFVFILTWLFFTPAQASSSANLLAMYQAIKNKQVDLLEAQPLHVQSDLSGQRLQADIFAINRYHFSTQVQRLSAPENWCDFITLHLNIKACTYQLKPEVMLSFYAGRKFYQAADDAYELRYRFVIDEFNENYFKLHLQAEQGPFATTDYLISFEMLKVGDDTLLHISLSYQTSFSSRLGTSVYLSTIGADKVGFSKADETRAESKYIGGIEAIIERNVMRYFLAITTYLANQSDLSQMPEQWFLSTEKYHRQLHEVELADYLAAKKREFNQQRQMQYRLNAGKPVFESSADD